MNSGASTNARDTAALLPTRIIAPAPDATARSGGRRWEGTSGAYVALVQPHGTRVDRGLQRDAPKLPQRCAAGGTPCQ